MDISVVVPVYNEVDNVVPLLDELSEALAGLPRGFEVIVVDDGSRDGTSDLLAQAERRAPLAARHLLPPQFRAIRRLRRRLPCGDGRRRGDDRRRPAERSAGPPGDDREARRGLRHDRRLAAKAERRDDPAQDPVADRERPHPQGDGQSIHDLGCSLRVYRREVTEELRLYGEMHRFISVLADNMGARIGEVEVNHRPRRAGASKYGLRRTVKVMLDSDRHLPPPVPDEAHLRVRQLRPRDDVLSLVAAAVVLWEKFHDGVWVHRNPLFILAALAGLVGVQLLATGIVAELIIRTYFESQGKRAYSVASRAGFDEESRR